MKKHTRPVRIAIAVAKFNEEITVNLHLNCIKELIARGISEKNITTVWVPGTYELPFMTQRLAQTKRYDAIIALGCVIKGETSHDQHVAGWAANGLGQVSILFDVPVFFGVLTPNTETQARKRSKPGPLNRGREVAAAAIDMLTTLNEGRF